MTANSWDIELAKIQENTARANADAVRAQEKMMEWKAARRRDRHEFLGPVLFGLAVVVILLGIIGGFWHGAVSDDDDMVEKEKAETAQIEACLNLPDAAERQLCILLLDADVDAAK